MPETVHNIIKLFADDTKLVGIIRNVDDCRRLQSYINGLSHWADDWRVFFHPEKCKMMRFGNNPVMRELAKLNDPLNFTIAISNSSTVTTNNNSNTRHKLALSDTEKDLGVIITSNLKWDAQTRRCINTANTVLATLKRTFKTWNCATFKQLFNTFVRPHLEYAAPVWNPQRKRNIKAIELVQRRATKLVRNISSLSYDARLSILGMTSLEERRRRGDIIQFFKCVNNYNDVNWFHW